MKSNKRSHRIMIATLALGVGAGVLFFGHKLNWIQKLDLAAVETAHQSTGIFHEYDPETGNITVNSLIPSKQDSHVFQRVIINDDPERIFETTPPSALDYAVILESLHNRGYRRVNISTRLNWENKPGLLAAGLDLRLALFESTVIPLAVTRGPKEGEMPKMLERALIRPSQIYGNADLVPTANRTSLSPQFTGGATGVLAGFHSIDSSPPAAGRIAMLARWSDKGMIPSYELLTIMQTHAITPSEVKVHCDKYIRLGRKGPVIAIDHYGQATPPALTTNHSTTKPLHADTIITQKKSDSTLQHIATIHARGEHTSPTNAISADRLDNALAMTRTFPVPGNSTLHRRLPLWAKLVILVDLAMIVFWLRGVPRSSQHLGFALTAALLLPLLHALMDVTQHWMMISAPLAIVLTGWLAPFSSKRRTSSMPEYHTQDPKPVIRA